jgi:hypothetical protein
MYKKIPLYLLSIRYIMQNKLYIIEFYPTEVLTKYNKTILCTITSLPICLQWCFWTIGTVFKSAHKNKNHLILSDMYCIDVLQC